MQHLTKMTISFSALLFLSACGGGGGGGNTSSSSSGVSEGGVTPPPQTVLRAGSLDLGSQSLIPTYQVGQSYAEVLFESGTPASFNASSLTSGAEYKIVIADTAGTPQCAFADGTTVLKNTDLVSVTSQAPGLCTLSLEPGNETTEVDSVLIRFDNAVTREYGPTIGDVWKHDESASGSNTLSMCVDATADRYGAANIYADKIDSGPLAGDFICMAEFSVFSEMGNSFLGLQEIIYAQNTGEGSLSAQILASCKTLAESDQGVRAADYQVSFVNSQVTRIETPSQSYCQTGGKSHDTGFRDVAYGVVYNDSDYSYSCVSCITFIANTSIGGRRGDRVFVLKGDGEGYYALEYISDILN